MDHAMALQKHTRIKKAASRKHAAFLLCLPERASAFQRGFVKQ